MVDNRKDYDINSVVFTHNINKGNYNLEIYDINEKCVFKIEEFMFPKNFELTPEILKNCELRIDEGCFYYCDLTFIHSEKIVFCTAIDIYGFALKGLCIKDFILISNHEKENRDDEIIERN